MAYSTEVKMNVLSALVEVLRRADNGLLATSTQGICGEVGDILHSKYRADLDAGFISDVYLESDRYFEYLTDTAWPEWPRFSGSSAYPIPGGDSAYWGAYRGDLWSGSQGIWRRSLLRFTIDFVQKEIQE